MQKKQKIKMRSYAKFFLVVVSFFLLMSEKEFFFRPHLSISPSFLAEGSLEKGVFSPASFFLLVNAHKLDHRSAEPARRRYSSHLVDDQEGGSLALQMQPNLTCSSGFSYKFQCVCFFESVDGVEPYLCDDPLTSSSVAPSSSAPTPTPGGSDNEEDTLGSKTELNSPSLAARLPFLLAYVILIGAIGGYMIRSMSRSKDETEAIIVTAVEREESDDDREGGRGVV